MADFHFDLLRPCADCPFRRHGGITVTPERAREIGTTLRDGGCFPCHKTVDYDKERVHSMEDGEHFCAGAIAAIMNDSKGRPTQPLRHAERFGIAAEGYIDKVHKAAGKMCFPSFAAMEAEMVRREVTAAGVPKGKKINDLEKLSLQEWQELITSMKKLCGERSGPITIRELALYLNTTQDVAEQMAEESDHGFELIAGHRSMDGITAYKKGDRQVLYYQEDDCYADEEMV